MKSAVIQTNQFPQLPSAVTPRGAGREFHLNAASGAPTIAPGAFIAIYGLNFAGITSVAPPTLYPTQLGDTQVLLGGGRCRCILRATSRSTRLFRMTSLRIRRSKIGRASCRHRA